MTTTYLEVERFAGRLYAQIEMEARGTVVPASGVERDRGGNPVQPGEPEHVEDLRARPVRAVVSLADEDREVWRSEAGASRAEVWRGLHVRGFEVLLTKDERAHAKELLCEAAEAEREGDPDRWRDERIEREMRERKEVA